MVERESPKLRVASSILARPDCVMDLEDKSNSIDQEIEALIEERRQARANKDFARSDAIRDQLKEQGILLDDTPQGTVWKRVNRWIK